MKEVTRVAQLRTAAAFREHLRASGVSLDFDEEVQSGEGSPLAQPCLVGKWTIGNRFAILPMEGWDGTADGRPTELTTRRWRRFGLSGAKLIFGGEAVTARLECRANPNGLTLTKETQKDMATLLATLVKAHEEAFGRSDDLLVGLQLSDAGRFTRPFDKKKPEPRAPYHHPILDRTVGLAPDAPVLTDDDIARSIDDLVHTAALAQKTGFGFVDIKHCHGYLGHELLSAVDRPGRYGGSFENRTRFLREMVAGIRSEAPGLGLGVRLSAFDFVPFQAGKDGIGEPAPFKGDRYPYAFGGDGTGVGIDLAEPLAFLDTLLELDIRLVCITGGCGYYNYHIIRPCFTPSRGGYLPPEEPLLGVARLVKVTSELKRLRPQLTCVVSGLSYLQEWLPNVAQAIVRKGQADFAGIGRMAISYPEMVADVLAGRPLQRAHICRACSRCTTAPRHGLVSGCYLTDPFYRARPEYEQLEQLLRS
jgi:2,4-dienoyl-CoA reductase-like NADH-dependent reductase (Old Yellow Enzyme family)